MGADELCFLDITASHEKRGILLDVVRRTAEVCFMPLTVGGGVRTLDDIRALLAGRRRQGLDQHRSGAPAGIRARRRRRNSAASASSPAIDAKQVAPGRFEVFTHGGRTPTGIDAVAHAVKLVDYGAGEILLTSMDRNPYIHPDFERRSTTFLRDYGVSDRSKLPWMVIVDGGVAQTPLGAVFLILPIGLLALREQTGCWFLLCYSSRRIYLANIGTRFMLPSLPFLSLALAIACEELPPVLLLIILFHAVASWPRILTRYVTDNTLVLRRTPFRAARRRQSEDSFLGESPIYRAARLIEHNVPTGERVLAMGGVADAYTSREVSSSTPRRSMRS